MKLSFAIIAVAFAAAFLLFGCAGTHGVPPLPGGNNTTGPVACSSDAKVCPDGSAVGRTGPNCEFAACPQPCGGIANAKCQEGHRCMIYNPENKTDAVGKCVPNATAAIPELAGNPEKYLNRSVIAEGTLSLEGNMFREGKFSLDDGGSSVRVTAWAPFSVSTCPPSVKDCSPPRTISYYIGKRVKVNGTLGFFGDAKTGYYMLVVNNAEIVGMPGAFAMTKGLCEAARGSWNECASACRGAPEGTACTMQCVQECECGGLAGFGCPEGYACTDYLPKEAEDAMGVCKPISSGMTRELCESGRGLWADERRACLCGGENDNRCPASYECDYSGVSKLITDPQGVCKPANGEMTKELCETGRGDFVVNNNGEGACVCGGFAGFGCPKGYECNYSEQGYDVMGACVKTP